MPTRRSSLTPNKGMLAGIRGMSVYLSQGQELCNRFNWLALFRAFWVLTNPFQFLIGLLRHQAPETVRVRTPVGRITLALRNIESLKTLFSVFCRQDYYVSQEKPYLFLDIGANIGLAGAYFLSRNPRNIVKCFEPDFTNIDHLKRNLAAFPGRAEIIDHAVAVRSGVTVLYRSADGKHSSLNRSERAQTPQETTASAFDKIVKNTSLTNLPTVIKLDVEGMEFELVRSVQFENHDHVHRLIYEGIGYSQWVSRPHALTVRNGYIEDLSFVT
jgi:FkbM family methyltransferase